MNNLTQLFQHGLTYGAILSLLMSGTLLGGAYFSPEIMLRGYPPEIKARYGPMSEQSRGHLTLIGMAIGAALFGTLIVSIIRLPLVSGGVLTFSTIFLSTVIILMTNNLVDLLILDWLIFVTIQPTFVVLPGTEGMPGYQDYGFHFRQFLKGSVGMLIASLVIAGLTMAVLAVSS
jgi:hypothetical protein